MKNMTVKIAVLEKAMEDFKEAQKVSDKQNGKDHTDILCEVNEVKNIVKAWIKDADNKYASKLTEKIVYGLVGIIVTGFLGSILILVFRIKL